MKYPSSFDWRNVNGVNYISPAKDQNMNRAASCTSFAVCAMLDACARIQLNIPVPSSNGNGNGNGSFDVSEAHLLFSNTTALIGMNIPDALNYCQKKGVVSEMCWPYNLDKPHKPWWCRDCGRKTTQISDWIGMKDPNHMKQWIASKGPLVTSMICDESYITYTDGVYGTQPPQKFLGFHGVCCIGYDDNKQAWLCKNSFGTGWGIQGCFWVQYGACDIDSKMFGVVGFSEVFIPPSGDAATSCADCPANTPSGCAACVPCIPQMYKDFIKKAR